MSRWRLRRPGFGSGPLSPMPDWMMGLASGNSAALVALLDQPGMSRGTVASRRRTLIRKIKATFGIP
jgi:hypothetical protein